MTGKSSAKRPRWKWQGHGAENSKWLGDDASEKAGRKRAVRWFPLKPCELCGSDGVERHHRDGNPLNNAPDNVQVLCRRCHMKIDGRLAEFTERIARLGSASKGKKLSAEHVEKSRQANIGRKASAEARRHQSEAQKRRWARLRGEK